MLGHRADLAATTYSRARPRAALGRRSVRHVCDGSGFEASTSTTAVPRAATARPLAKDLDGLQLHRVSGSSNNVLVMNKTSASTVLVGGPAQSTEAPPASPARDLEEAARQAPQRRARPVLQAAEMSTAVSAILLAGAESTTPLTTDRTGRAMAAMPFGSNLKLIDVPINIIASSGINKMFVLSQFNARSLFTHVNQSYMPTYGSPANSSFVDMVTCTQNPSNSAWYRGAAEAVARNLQVFLERCPHAQDFVITSGHSVSDVDVQQVLRTHRQQGADITVVTASVSKEQAQRMGVLKVDPESGLVSNFVEKPAPAILEQLARGSGRTSTRAPYEASTGTYVFRRDTLLDLLGGPDGSGMGHVSMARDVLPAALSWGLHVAAHHHNGYWQAVRTVGDLHASTLDLAAERPALDLTRVYNSSMRRQLVLPPARLVNATLNHCLVGDGSVIEGSILTHTVVGQNCYIGPGCHLERTVLLGNDNYQSTTAIAQAAAAGQPVFGIGQGSVVRGAIIDSGVSIGRNVRLTNASGVREADRADSEGYVIQDGVLVLISGAVLRDNTVI